MILPKLRLLAQLLIVFQILTKLSEMHSNSGSKGNGKTTLIKDGVCKALNRPFSLIALGGLSDASYFHGHEYTYEGARAGRIVDILTETGCMDPVIYFDELDKLSETPKR